VHHLPDNESRQKQKDERADYFDTFVQPINRDQK